MSAKPFILFFVGRCGSSYIRHALDTHPQIRMVGEILTEHRAQPALQLEAARAAFSPDDHGVRAVGFKTKFRDVVLPEKLRELLLQVEAKVIHLQRNNKIRHALSRLNAQRLYKITGRHNLFREEDRLQPFAVDPRHLHSTIHMFERQVRVLEKFTASLPLPLLTVAYEELLVDHDGVMANLCSFLEVAIRPLQGNVLKATPNNLREAITNYEEVRAYFNDTEYREMLDP